MKSIIALDQSTHLSGFSYWQDGEFLDSGILKAKNIKEMYILIKSLIDKYKPNTLVIEDMFFLPQSAKSAIPLARLQGLIMSICYELNIDLYIVTPNKWRKILGISTYKKHTDELKMEVQKVIENKYNIKSATNDESDAVAIGYWFWNSANIEDSKI